MRIHTFQTEIWLPRPLEEVFAFFSDAGNLDRLTPPWLRFEILTPRPIAMRPGALIDYRLRLRGIPIRWRSEITAWEPPFRFVDEQRRGPYRLWRHQHTFAERDGGTVVGDRVEYAVWGGALVNKLFVERDVRAIFRYRQQTLQSLFGAAAKPSACTEAA
jgi:ligand-binding SRPBCC domain-containing protein